MSIKYTGKPLIIASDQPQLVANWVHRHFKRPHEDLVAHPHQLDLEYLTPSKTTISIAQVRQACTWLNQPAHQYNHKILIINPADSLTHEAQNALLKILEEPPHQAVIILATISPNKLLSTIISRAYPIKTLPQPTANASTPPGATLNLINSLSTSPAARRLSLLPPKLDSNQARQIVTNITTEITQPGLNLNNLQKATIFDLSLQALQRLENHTNPESVLADLYLAWPTK